jgi:hypothetical protein
MAIVKPRGPQSHWRAAVQQANGIVGISLHSWNHVGEALDAMVDWINREGRFNQLIISLSDTLNAPNYEVDTVMSREESSALARVHGDGWLERNAERLARLDSRFSPRVIRWDYWKHEHGDKTEDYRKQFEHAFEKNEEFRRVLASDIQGNFERRFADRSAAFKAHHFDKSKEYLIDELAVYSVMFERFPGTKLYPGRELACFDLLRSKEVAGVPQRVRTNSSYVRLGVHHTPAKAPTQEPVSGLA